MYIKTYAKVYPSKLKETEKMARRQLGISHKKPDGTIENDYWDGKFVGKAKEDILSIPEKTLIEITGNAFTGYDKENRTSYPYILVNSFRVVEKTESKE